MINDPQGNPIIYIEALEDALENVAAQLAVVGEWDDPATVMPVERQRQYEAVSEKARSLRRAITWYKLVSYSQTNWKDRQ